MKVLLFKLTAHIIFQDVQPILTGKSHFFYGIIGQKGNINKALEDSNVNIIKLMKNGKLKRRYFNNQSLFGISIYLKINYKEHHHIPGEFGQNALS